MKKFNKLLRLLSLAICLSIVFSVNVFAEETKEENDYKNVISNLMLPIIESPDTYGLENIDFSNVYIGEKITPYNMINGVIEKSDFAYCPILSNNKIICIATVSQIDGKPSVQIGKDFSNELQNYITTNQSNIALIHYDNNLLIKSENKPYEILYSYQGEPISKNELLNLSDNGLDYLGIKITENLDLSKQINQIEKVRNEFASYNYRMSYVPDSKILSVPHVKDDTNYTCWATAVASIGKYKTNISKAPKDITRYLGVTGDKDAGSPENVARAFSGIYKLQTHKVNSNLTYTNITNNIIDDKPIYSVWQTTRKYNGNYNYHAVVVSGYTGKLIYGSNQCSFTYVDNVGGKKVSNVNHDGDIYIVSNGKEYKSQYYIVLL